MPNPAKRDTPCVFPKTMVLVIRELVLLWKYKLSLREGVADGEIVQKESRSHLVSGGKYQFK